MENLAKEPYATQIAIINIILLTAGTAMALVLLTCSTNECEQSGSIGQVIIALSIFLLASVEAYMKFMVAIINPGMDFNI